MANLVEIQQQIEKLQKQAKEIKTREFDRTVQEIRSKMAAFGITASDLRLGKKPSARLARTAVAPVSKARSASAKPRIVVAPKYRGPNGEVWSGRGLMPRWMAALVAQGQTKESFLISP